MRRRLRERSGRQWLVDAWLLAGASAWLFAIHKAPVALSAWDFIGLPVFAVIGPGAWLIPLIMWS